MLQAINSVAEQAAEKAANSVAEKVRAEMLLELQKMRTGVISDVQESVKKALDDRFGDMSHHEHYSEHKRLKGMFGIIDMIKQEVIVKGFWALFICTLLVSLSFKLGIFEDKVPNTQSLPPPTYQITKEPTADTKDGK